MTTEEATGRLNLFDDPSPLSDTENITKLISGIRKKTRGADVREAIAKALEVTYDTAGSQGNANMEVARARGTAQNLAQRLENMDRLTASTVQQIGEAMAAAQALSTGSPKGAYANLAALQAAHPKGAAGIFIVQDTGHWYFYNDGWKDGGLYQSPVQPDLVEYDLTSTSFSDVVGYYQIHNASHNDAAVENGKGYPTFSKANNDIGSVITGAGSQSYWERRMVVVNPGEIYSCRIQMSQEKKPYVYFLDASGVVIGRAVHGTGTAVAAKRYEVIVPPNATEMLVLSFESGSVVYQGLTNTAIADYRPAALKGKYEQGTSSNGVFTALNRRVTTREIIKYSQDVILRINRTGFVFFVQLMNADGTVIKAIKENVEVKIPANTYFRPTIMYVDDRNADADAPTFYYALSCYVKGKDSQDFTNESALQRFIANASNQKSLYGIQKSNISKRYPTTLVAELGKEGFQSCAFDHANDTFYKFGWFDNASKAIKYRLSTGEELARIAKGDTGHDNDAVYINGKVYIAGVDKRTKEGARALFKWDIASNKVTSIDTSRIPEPNNGSWRCVAAVCQFEDTENLYVICTDHNYNEAFEGTHNSGDMLSVHFLNPTTGATYLAWQMPWDEMYVQGATCVNDIMYVACNKMVLPGQPYVGITIKVIDLVARMQVDEIQFIGNYEPESLNHVYENGNLYLLLGVAKYNSFSKVVKIKID